MSNIVQPERKASRTSNYIRGLGTGYVATIATIVVGLWLTPFTLRFLDREEYAVFALASDVLMWLGLLDIGISAGLNVQAAQLSGRPDQEKLNRLASTAFFTQNVVVFAILIVGSGVAVGFPVFFPIRADLHGTTSAFLLLLVLGSAIGFGTRTFSALLVANQQIHIDNLIRLALIAIRTVLTVVLLKQGWGLYSLAFATLAATIVTSAIAVLRTYRLLPGLQIRWHLASWEVLKSMGTLGVWFSLGGLAGVVIGSCDRVVAGKLISMESVTTLSLTGRMYLLSRTFLDQISNTARPMLGQLIGQNKLEVASRAYTKMFTLSTGLAIIATASVWAGNGAFVSRWVGSHNYGGWLLDLAFAFGLVANSWVLPNRAILAASSYKLPQHIVCRVAGALLCLPLSIFLGLRLGLPGIVFATLVAELCTSCWFLPLLTAQMFHRQFSGFIREQLRPFAVTLFVLIPTAGVTRLISEWVIGGFLGAAVSGITTFSTGATLLWLFAFDAELKAEILHRLRSAADRIVASSRLHPARIVI